MNCSKYFLIYILGQKHFLRSQKHFELYKVLIYNLLYQNDLLFIKFSELYHVFVAKRDNSFKLYITDRSKNITH